MELSTYLLERDYSVIGTVTDATKLPLLFKKNIIPHVFSTEHQSLKTLSFLTDCDTVIISIPPKLKNNAPKVFLSRMKHLSEMLITFNISHTIFISSTSVYPNSGYFSESRTSITNHPLLTAEDFFKDKPFSTTIIRPGGLFGPKRHPGNFMKRKEQYMGGLSPINLIHSADLIKICVYAIENKYNGIINAVHPDHPTRSEFYSRAVESLSGKKVIFTDENSKSKIVKSEQLAKLGFSFKHNKLIDYLQDC